MGIKISDLTLDSAPSLANSYVETERTGSSFKSPLGDFWDLMRASAALTGTPTAPTAAAGTNTTQIATTAFVKAAVDVVLGGVSSAFDTLSEIATELALKAPLASPALTGNPTAPTPTAGDNDTSIATTSFVTAAVAAAAAPSFSGDTLQTGNITLALSDAWKAMRWSNVSATVTIPTNASVAFPIGTQIIFGLQTTGTSRTITFTGAAGVTVRGSIMIEVLAATQWCSVFLVKVATDTWYIAGAGSRA